MAVAKVAAPPMPHLAIAATAVARTCHEDWAIVASDDVESVESVVAVSVERLAWLVQMPVVVAPTAGPKMPLVFAPYLAVAGLPAVSR